MKNINKILIALLVVFLFQGTGRSLAQQPDFVVYYVKGNVQKINTPRHVLLKKKDKLNLSDWVSIPNHSQLILICRNYNSFKLDKADTIKLSTLTESCESKKTSFTSAYFHFVWDELNDKEPIAQNNMHNVGAVSRAIGQLDTFNVWLDTINYFDGPLKVDWFRKSKVAIKIYKDIGDDNPIREFNVYQTSVKLDSLIALLDKPGIYYWTISSNNDTNIPKFYLRLWAQSDYKSAVDSVLKVIVNTNPAETAYMSGFLLEQSGFLTEASKYYRQAYALQPKNTIYQSAKSRFDE